MYKHNAYKAYCAYVKEHITHHDRRVQSKQTLPVERVNRWNSLIEESHAFEFNQILAIRMLRFNEGDCIQTL